MMGRSFLLKEACVLGVVRAGRVWSVGVGERKRECVCVMGCG